MVARVCLVSSGTGGHLWPALVLGQRLREVGHDTWLVTEGRAVEQDLLARAGLEADPLPVAAGGPVGFGRATWAARRMLRERRAEAVVCTGGRTSLAVGLAAQSLRLPVFVLEQNAVTGRANRLLGHFAERVYLGLPNKRLGRRQVLTGTPLRSEFGRLDRRAARAELGLPTTTPTVFVTGGSQGAQALNQTAPPALVEVARRRGAPLTVVHLSGAGNDAAVRGLYADAADVGLQAVVRPLALDMATLYAAADVVVCRGGGCTVAELCQSGRASVVVPYPHHRDQQQRRNAEVLVGAGAARILDQAELTPERLASELVAMFEEPGRLDRMGAAAARLAPADPCATILADVGEAVDRHARRGTARHEERHADRQ